MSKKTKELEQEWNKVQEIKVDAEDKSPSQRTKADWKHLADYYKEVARVGTELRASLLEDLAHAEEEAAAQRAAAKAAASREESARAQARSFGAEDGAAKLVEQIGSLVLAAIVTLVQEIESGAKKPAGTAKEKLGF